MTPQGWAGARQQSVATRQAPPDAHASLFLSSQESKRARPAAGGEKVLHGSLGSKALPPGGPATAVAGGLMLSAFRTTYRN